MIQLTGIGRGLPILALALSAVCLDPALAQRGPFGAPQSVPPAPVQQQYPSGMPPVAQNPVCARLETQLASVERGGGDVASNVRRYEEIATRQQAQVDQLANQARRYGCQSAGIFSIFTQQPPQCQGIMSQLDNARSQLDRAMNDVQRARSGGASDLESQRQSLILQLAQNNCGPQYRAAAAAAPQRGIFETIFGGGATGTYGGVDISQGGTFRTLCVRTCDGYYYPISFATSPSHFPDDEQTCRNTCPAAEVALYSHRTSEDVRSAATNRGQRYVDLPNAFRYRQQYDASCSCRKPGQSWADAMGQTSDVLRRGDIVVTDEKAKAMSQPQVSPPARGQQGRNQPAQAASQPQPQAAAEPAPAPPPPPGGIRTVGPAGWPVRQ